MKWILIGVVPNLKAPRTVLHHNKIQYNLLFDQHSNLLYPNVLVDKVQRLLYLLRNGGWCWEVRPFRSEAALVSCVVYRDDCALRGRVGVAAVLHQRLLVLHSHVLQEPRLLGDYVVAGLVAT